MTFGGKPGKAGQHIAIVDLATQRLTELKVRGLRGPIILQQLAWAADNQHFYVTGFAGRDYVMLRVAPNGEVRVLVRQGYGWMNSPRVSADGRHLVWVRMDSLSDIWTAELVKQP